MKDFGFTLALLVVAMLPTNTIFADCAESTSSYAFLELTSATIDGEPADVSTWEEDRFDYVLSPVGGRDTLVFSIYDKATGGEVYNDFMTVEDER